MDADREAAIQKQAEDDRQQREENERVQAAKARRQKIFAQLDALPEKEATERETLQAQIAQLRAYIVEVQQYLAKLQGEIQSLQLDIQLGQAFGGPRAPIGMSRKQLLQLKLQEYQKYQATLSQSQANLRQAEEQLRMLRINYERVRGTACSRNSNTKIGTMHFDT